MTMEEMNPGSLYLREGQVITVNEFDSDTRRNQKKYIQIIKLYRHHALCMVNGKHRESFTYNELYTMKVVGSSA